ncbi:hypothetical protein [Nocardia concava]|uniref:hypothetical protein n=1 Tax=Nocardia concava TaxID=257281 RepID=UPI0003128A40|nr:hypothetical protein [Nocardia concava]
MSTTESNSRTTGSEPPNPAEDDEYTGSWSDWITGAPAPTRARHTRDDEYASGYDEYDDFGDEDDEYFEPRPLPREEYFEPQPDEEYYEPHSPSRAESSESGPGSRDALLYSRSSEHPQHARAAEQPPAARPSGTPRRATYKSPRARTAYDVLQARASFDPSSRPARGDLDGPPPGYPTERRPLKRQTRTSPKRERFGFSLNLSGRKWAVPLLGLLAILAVTAAVAVQIAKLTGDSTSAKPGLATPPAATPPAVAPAVTTPPTASAFDQPAAAVPAGLCPNETKGGNVRGNGPGSTKSGPDVILALQNRYYVDRSGKAVREMFAPDAAAPTIEQIQAGIDSIPAGTTYCVQIMPGPFDGQHVMVVTEQHPDATKRTWAPQLVLTTKIGDATLISAIVPLNADTPK